MPFFGAQSSCPDLNLCLDSESHRNYRLFVYGKSDPIETDEEIGKLKSLYLDLKYRKAVKEFEKSNFYVKTDKGLVHYHKRYKEKRFHIVDFLYKTIYRVESEGSIYIKRLVEDPSKIIGLDKKAGIINEGRVDDEESPTKKDSDSSAASVQTVIYVEPKKPTEDGYAKEGAKNQQYIDKKKDKNIVENLASKLKGKLTKGIPVKRSKNRDQEGDLIGLQPMTSAASDENKIVESSPMLPLKKNIVQEMLV